MLHNRESRGGGWFSQEDEGRENILAGSGAGWAVWLEPSVVQNPSVI